MTGRTDEQGGGPGVGQPASQARRITLLSWLLVVTMAASAECAWVLWLQDHWTAPTENRQWTVTLDPAATVG